MTKELIITIDGERPVSWNEYIAAHWVKRKKLTDYIHRLVQASLHIMSLEGHDLTHLTPPVDIHTIAYITGRSWIDSDNVCDKLYIDGLKKMQQKKIGKKFITTNNPYWVIENDNPHYVRDATTRSVPGNTKPRVEIHVKEVA